MYGKTITTFLVDGNPNGIKTMELSNWVGKAIFIPRAKIKEAKNRSELNQPSLYVLLEKNGLEIYIGESESLFSRITNHDANKDFWEIVIAFISTNNSLTKADVKYLEFLGITEAIKIKRFSLSENKAIPQEPNLPEHQKATVLEFFSNIKLLISALGYPVFEAPYSKEEEEDIFYCKGKESKGKAIYNENGVTVLKGSLIPKKSEKSLERMKGVQEKQKILLENKILQEKNNDAWELTEDIVFSSPSYAASFVLSRPANGWIEWKDKNGKTLDSIFRTENL